MLVGPARARDLPVSDVLYEDVPEGVLGLACNRGVLLAADELLAFQSVQPLLDRPAG